MNFILVFFVLGRPGYKVIIPENNIVKEFFQCIGVIKAFKYSFNVCVNLS